MKLAFMTANYVAEALQYRPGLEWGAYQEETFRKFHSASFAYEFEQLLYRIKRLGFNALELWVAHLDPLQATPEMIKTAVGLLERYELEVVSYTPSFRTPHTGKEEIKKVYETAKAIGAPVLANGFHASNAPVIYELGKQYGIKYGIENHPEKNAQEVLSQIEGFAPWIGSTLDTGWFATQGYDPVKAVWELKDHLVHVHLKDVAAAGEHDSCELGQGIVPIADVISHLKAIHYQGALTIEHEPMDHDPSDEVMKSLIHVRQLLNDNL
ncbi:sugar phosphate isomerase/epimerase family protein [Paenibacillus glycanilyticus]|uniref:sugar phosphate isomerase/epimerase family protein n=1 Tax=Paenibacillus glycanilyticus TaxID=126569 RepID=UPI000FDAC446|nr:sugar phosphate isomerase/epimerase [Paenibacillus glycanilyticus]